MSDEQKIKDHIAEVVKLNKEIDERLNKAVTESQQARQESTAEPNQY